MKITLLASTELRAGIDDLPLDFDDEVAGPDVLAEASGRACYQSWSKPNPATAKTEDYVANVIELGHESVLAHAAATFYIEGVSRSLTHELVRHRFLVFSELSQRYVNVADAEVVTPPLLTTAEGEGFAAARRALVRSVDAARAAYAEIIEALEGELGTDRETRKAIRQAARAVMPNAIETKIVVSGNFRAWRDFLRQRLSPHADAEIRALAEALRDELVQLAPATFADAAGWSA